jgi:hypothetical protein
MNISASKLAAGALKAGHSFAGVTGRETRLESAQLHRRVHCATQTPASG